MASAPEASDRTVACRLPEEAEVAAAAALLAAARAVDRRTVMVLRRFVS